VWPLLCATTIFAAVGATASMGRTPHAIAPVFANGSEGYRCYRIPAIVQMDGALLAFAEARRSGCGDFGDVRIVMRSSHDGGKSWGALETVASNGSLQAGNPVPVVDAIDARYPKGRVLLIYNTGDAPESAIREGRGTRRVWYRASSDDGATWSVPVEITASVKKPAWRSYGVGPGHGLQLTRGQHKGRIFIAAYHSEGAPQPGYRDSAAHGFFSDDHGGTWHLAATVAWPGSNESTAAQAGDGSVVMNSRDQSGDSHARILSISSSGGERWEKTFVAHDLPDAVCEGSMLTYRRGMLFSNLRNTEKDRHGLAVSESLDEGRSWPKHTVIYGGASAYSDLVAMRGGVLGILFERENDGVVFVKRPVAGLF
jgi:sialidase-1